MSADGKQQRTGTKKERSEVEKQNKFTNKLPEAARLCRRTAFIFPLNGGGDFFKGRRKQRANREEGRRRRGEEERRAERLIRP